MLVRRVIQRLETLEATVQIRGEARRIVIAQGGFVETKSVLVVIREISNFLRENQYRSAA